MTCHEFESAAASLTLPELSRSLDKPFHEHAGDCPRCGAWLQQQRKLASSLQTLQAQTLQMEAGPQVEAELLRKFRGAPAEVAPPSRAFHFPSVALRLNRFFEIGAYAAVAAAIVIALVLGTALWKHRPSDKIAANRPLSPNMAGTQTMAAANTNSENTSLPSSLRANSVPRSAVRRLPAAGIAEDDSALSDPRSSGDQDYMALMLCDPLSCSSDAQLVRMELPASPADGRDTPQVADVVVGYDGVVRAVRIVN